MSAETLRNAAALMRLRAKRSVCSCGGPVCTIEQGWFREGELRECLGDGWDDRDPRVTSGDAVPHVLAWSPAVALAVADWLDVFANYDETGENAADETAAALTVARAYLGSAA